MEHNNENDENGEEEGDQGIEFMVNIWEHFVSIR